MKWKQDEVVTYAESRQYFDTVIIPVHALDIEEIGDPSYTGVKRLELVASRVEEQLRGRIVLLPAIHYYYSSDVSDSVREKSVQQFSAALFLGGAAQCRSFTHTVLFVSNLSLADHLQKNGFTVYFAGEDRSADRDAVNDAANGAANNAVEDAENELALAAEGGYRFLLELWKP